MSSWRLFSKWNEFNDQRYRSFWVKMIGVGCYSRMSTGQILNGKVRLSHLHHQLTFIILSPTAKKKNTMNFCSASKLISSNSRSSASTLWFVNLSFYQLLIFWFHISKTWFWPLGANFCLRVEYIHHQKVIWAIINASTINCRWMSPKSDLRVTFLCLSFCLGSFFSFLFSDWVWDGINPFM